MKTEKEQNLYDIDSLHRSYQYSVDVRTEKMDALKKAYSDMKDLAYALDEGLESAYYSKQIEQIDRELKDVLRKKTI